MTGKDPTPTLPLPGEGVSTNSSPWQGGGREGVIGAQEREHSAQENNSKTYTHPFSIHNSVDYKARRQSLRKNPSEPEKRLWRALRNSQLDARFRRQHGVGPYIADFYCAEWRLVIELDGHSHDSPQAQEYDAIRDQYMLSLGLHILRLSNHDVMTNLNAVLEHIRHQGATATSPTSTLK